MEELTNIINDAIAQIVSDYNEIVDEVIQSEDEFIAGQDIVDTGRLLDSKAVDISIAGTSTTATFTWAPNDPETGYPYAPAVWAGFFAYGGSKFIPPRHWPERAMKNLDPVNALADLLAEKGLEVEVLQNSIDELDD